MFLEYMGFLGMGAEPAFSFEFIFRIILVLFFLIAAIFIGFKIKEGLGVVIAFLLYVLFLIYINGGLPMLSL